MCKKSRLKIAEVVFTRQMKDFDLFKSPQQFGPNKCTHRLQIVAQNCNKSPNLVTLVIFVLLTPFGLFRCSKIEMEHSLLLTLKNNFHDVLNIH